MKHPVTHLVLSYRNDNQNDLNFTLNPAPPPSTGEKGSNKLYTKSALQVWVDRRGPGSRKKLLVSFRLAVMLGSPSRGVCLRTSDPYIVVVLTAPIHSQEVSGWSHMEAQRWLGAPRRPRGFEKSGCVGMSAQDSCSRRKKLFFYNHNS